MNDCLSPEEIRKFLSEPFRNIPIEIFSVLDSTNIYAKKIAQEGAPAGTLILAEEQTAGRGRQGKTFFAPPKSGIYMTTILRPNLPLQEALILTFAAGVAVCNAIESLTPYHPQIKWVNDVYLEQKKICGILAESAGNSNGSIPDAILMGIGLNVQIDEKNLPEELKKIVGSIFPENTEPSVSRNQFAAEIAERLLAFTEKLSGPNREEEKRRLLQTYKQKSLVLGKKIRYSQGQTIHSGTALDIAADGSLLVKKTSGEIQKLQSGEISLIKDSLWDF